MCVRARVCVRACLHVCVYVCVCVYTGAVLYLFTCWIPEQALDRARLESRLCIFPGISDSTSLQGIWLLFKGQLGFQVGTGTAYVDPDIIKKREIARLPSLPVFLLHLRRVLRLQWEVKYL